MNKSKDEFGFAKKPSTSICLEQAKADNPYVTEKQYIAGYDLEALIEKKSFVEVLFMLFKLDLPDPKQTRLLEKLMIGLINAGPRHVATRAAMVTGISKTNAEHILPIGLMVLGGQNGGASEVAAAHQFFSDSIQQRPADVLKQLLAEPKRENQQIAPGFGQHYGEADPLVQRLATTLCSEFTDCKALAWGNQLAACLEPAKQGWRDVGLAAAVFYDLELPARESIGLYQLIRAPGILAHGMEQTHRPITDMPLLEDSQYVVKPKP